MNTNFRSNKIIKFREITLLSLCLVLLIPLSSCKDEVKSKPDVKTSPQSNITKTQIGSSQSFIGRWKLKIYTGGLYAGGVAGTVYSYGRDANVILDYTFNSDGTFKSLVPKLILGTYKVNNNILKMNFRDGTVKQYSYSFEEANGPNGTTFRYLLLKEPGTNEPVRFHLE
jgi:hypothetical protein